MLAPMNRFSPIRSNTAFELAASRCADLTPLVYQRLFDEHPETRAMFRTQGSELVMGSMLALTSRRSSTSPASAAGISG